MAVDSSPIAPTIGQPVTMLTPSGAGVGHAAAGRARHATGVDAAGVAATAHQLHVHRVPGHGRQTAAGRRAVAAQPGLHQRVGAGGEAVARGDAEHGARGAADRVAGRADARPVRDARAAQNAWMSSRRCQVSSVLLSLTFALATASRPSLSSTLVSFASRSRGASESMTICPSEESKCVANETSGRSSRRTRRSGPGSSAARSPGPPSARRCPAPCRAVAPRRAASCPPASCRRRPGRARSPRGRRT